ncbi:MAG: hypothetical protein FJX61_10830 [Alphaproteobacteria bacterium]|nr:hypothetical protein [Alphaproteobacteria bacterium]
MRTLRLLVRTATFRLALIYLVLFVASVAALGGFYHWATTEALARQSDETIAAEIQGLAEHYERRSVAGLRDVVAERSHDQRHSLYLLVAAGLVEPANRHGAARHALIARHEDLRAQDDEMLRAYYDTWGRYMSRSAADLSRRGRAAE